MTCKDQPHAEQHQTFVGVREREATYFGLQTRVQLQVVDVAVQLARNSLLSPITRVDSVCQRAAHAGRTMNSTTDRDFRVRVPLFEAVEGLEAKEGPELVHGAHAPLARHYPAVCAFPS